MPGQEIPRFWFGQPFHEILKQVHNIAVAVCKFLESRDASALTSWAAPHSHRACTPVSGSLPKQRHKSSGTIFLFAKFARDGNISWHAHQSKTLILFGTSSFQIIGHTCWPAEPVEHSTLPSLPPLPFVSPPDSQICRSIFVVQPN